MAKVLNYAATNGQAGAVIIDRITHLTSEDGGRITHIHLDTGAILYSTTRLELLLDRIDLADKTKP